MKTYEEGFIAGFSHNIKTVEELEEQIKFLKDSNIHVLEERIKKAINILKFCNSQCAKETIKILKGE